MIEWNAEYVSSLIADLDSGHKVSIGIDNGPSGSIGILRSDREAFFCKTPVLKQQDYTKKKKMISRLDTGKFLLMMREATKGASFVKISLERPMINSMMFNSSISAARMFEAQLVCLEGLSLPWEVIDSKEWQKKLLPSDAKGDQLKKASYDIGMRTFPHLRDVIMKQKDADGILIAEYLRLKNNNF